MGALMKVDANTSLAALGRARPEARGEAGFSLDGAGAAARPAAASGPSQAQALGAALALQLETIDPERRRRQIRRGQSALQALDEVALALLGGGSMEAAERALRAALAEASEETGEIGLDETLALIEQRAAIEMAKLELRRVKR